MNTKEGRQIELERKTKRWMEVEKKGVSEETGGGSVSRLCKIIKREFSCL